MPPKTRSNLGRKCKSTVAYASESESQNDDKDFQESPPKTKKSKPTSRKKDPGAKSKMKGSPPLILQAATHSNCYKKENTSTYSCCDYVYKKSAGIANPLQYQKVLKNLLMQRIRKFRVMKHDSTFDQRITSLVWHPKQTSILMAGSKWGEILLWNYNKLKPETVVKPQGPGGSIQTMKFDQFQNNKLYTASIDGTVCAKDLEGNNSFVYMSTNCHEQWFTSLDVSCMNGLLLAGDSKGIVHLLSKTGSVVSKYKLHKQKVTHIEFNTLLPWLMVTSSVDGTVKVWDVRQLEVDNALAVLPHRKAVNSAYFSPSHGNRILTTDQQNELNVFCGPFWDLETSIAHPHRHFQHLTQIRAQWHPLEDIVVVGRYPDPKFPGYTEGEGRSIDFFDADDGQLMYQLEEPGFNGITSLNQFNPVGTALASGMGSRILVWTPKFPVENKSLDVGEAKSTATIYDPKVRSRRRLNENVDDFKKVTKKLRMTKK